MRLVLLLFCFRRHKIYDEDNDDEIELTKEETRLVGRMLEGKAPHTDFEPHEIKVEFLFLQPYVDWFKWDDAKHPLSNALEPKGRFIPSKWENKMINPFTIRQFPLKCMMVYLIP
ncbi:hypothetical protein SLE2022_039730 [Rubroshorea leprosula]